jgi:hypothetical protein
MKGIRVVTALVALLALPLVAVHGQGRSKGTRANSDVCVSPAGNSGKLPPGQVKKCPAPPPPDTEPTPVPPPVPPPPSNPPPPTGVNFAGGTAFADLDGDGAYNPFAGDTVLAGVPVQLLWFGSIVQSAVTDANGAYRFDGLGNTGTNSWELCVTVPSGFTQSPPPGGVSYTGCGGTGYAFPFNSTVQAMYQGNFGMLPL